MKLAGMRNILMLLLFFSSIFFKLCLTVVPLFKRGILSEKRRKQKFYHNREVPSQDASSEVSEPIVAPPSPPNRGQQRATGYKPLYTNHQGFPGGEPRDAHW